ncbi:MAG: SGNH/GDSL hydrolase family protein [Clostridia bacterium]|nr:SGNH/GDSL hydrolase family protein [Clostridia bacterium]
MKRILFQGDSITDAGRYRGEDSVNKGYGYPTVCSAILGAKYPGEYEFINRGISGNRIVDLYARIKVDVINLAPDYMSILIGVNDVWHELGSKNGVDHVKFERIYDMFLEEVLTALPDIKIFILGPYVTEGTATNEKLDEFRAEVDLRAAAAKRLAEKYSMPYVDLQAAFDEAVKKAPADYWIADGVHPLAAGYGVITEKWIETFEQIR